MQVIMEFLGLEDLTVLKRQLTFVFTEELLRSTGHSLLKLYKMFQISMSNVTWV